MNAVGCSRMLNSFTEIRSGNFGESVALFVLCHDDFNKDVLLPEQLHTFHTSYRIKQNMGNVGVTEVLRSMSVPERALLSEVVKVQV